MATATQPAQAESPDIAGAVLAQMVREQLDQERRRKDSVELRGMAVITSAGVLVGLLLGLAGVAGTALIQSLPALAKWSALLALFLFAAAAVLGLLTNWAYKQQEPDIEQLQGLVDSHWSASAQAAAKYVAQSYLGSIASYREQGNKKATQLIRALTLEALAIVAMGVAVADILLFGMK